MKQAGNSRSFSRFSLSGLCFFGSFFCEQRHVAREPKLDYGLVIEPPPLVNSSTERQAHQGSFRAVIFTLSGGKEKMQVSSSR